MATHAIFARITTLDSSPWSQADIDKANAITGPISVTVETPDTICFQLTPDVLPVDTNTAKTLVIAIAQAFPQIPVSWGVPKPKEVVV